MAIAGMGGLALAAAPTSTGRVTTTGGGGGLGGGGDGRTGATCGCCCGFGARWAALRGVAAGAFGPDGAGGSAGFGAPSFGDFEKRLIRPLSKIPGSCSGSLESAAPGVDNVHIATECESRGDPGPSPLLHIVTDGNGR